MTRRHRQPKKLKTQSIVSKKTNKPEILTFKQACIELWKSIVWRIMPSEWMGKQVYIAGRWRMVTSETYSTVFVKGHNQSILKKNITNSNIKV